MESVPNFCFKVRSITPSCFLVESLEDGKVVDAQRIGGIRFGFPKLREIYKFAEDQCIDIYPPLSSFSCFQAVTTSDNGES